jgi:C-terminal peptidase prc
MRLRVKKTVFHITLLVLSLVFTSFLNCEPKKSSKKKEPMPDFTARDFESVVLSVERYYIDKNIDVDRAFTDAAVTAMATLPHGLFLYPEKYFEEREKYEEKEDLVPGTTFKLSPSDEFVIFNPDYKQLEKVRKEREKKVADKKVDLKDLVEKEKVKKTVLTSRWKEINFSKKDFNRVITFIQDNLSKYKKPPTPEQEVEKDDEDDGNTKDEFSMRDVYLAAANGYLNSLDPHSNVFYKRDWEESMAKIQDGSFEGIGAILSGGGNREVIVENPLEDRPAVKAGIRAGDAIVEVDGKRTKGLSLEKVVRRIKGKKGTVVNLKIKRKGTQGLISINVKRATIEIKNVSYNLVKENEHIGYIKLTGFVKTPMESSDSEIIKAYRELEKMATAKGTKLKALIFDLRGNSGGYLDLAIDISDMFIQEGVIVSTKSPNRPPDKSVANKPDLTDLPMAVLINAKSASASEIVASAIKHHGRGLLLGERTYGKATVQKLMDLPGNNAYVLKITQARYYSPSGQTIQVVGVDPDVPISSELDGSFPFQYREENMWHHLPSVESEEVVSKQYFNLEKLNQWVSQNGKATAYIEGHKNDPIKPDIQLIRSIDYIEGMLSTKDFGNIPRK